MWKSNKPAPHPAPFGPAKRSSTAKFRRSMDNPFVICEAVIPCPMFPRVGCVPSLVGPTFVAQPPFCPPFVFMMLRIAFSTTPLYSVSCELPYVFFSAPTSARSVLRFSRLQILVNHTVTNSSASLTKSTPLSSSKSELFGKKHPGVGCPPQPSVSKVRICPCCVGVSIGPTGAKLPLPGPGAIIPLCTSRVRRLALATHHVRHSPASRDRFSWG